MRKKLIAAIGFLTATCMLNAQEKPFTINGHITGKTATYIYLMYGNVGNRVIDSALIKNGEFVFDGMLDGPAQATVMIDKNGRSYDKYAQLYIEPSKMQVSVDYNDFTDEGIVLTGSSVQVEADMLNKAKAPIMAKLKPLREAYDKANGAYIEARRVGKDEATLETLKAVAEREREAMNPYFAQLSEVEREFMDKYPSSYVTASILRFQIARMPLNEGKDRYAKLADGVKNSALGKDIKKELDELQAGSPGAEAYVFSSEELSGGKLSLADYRGKYVLLDFWASWCVPCRRGNPHLLELYSTYKDKGFEIIGISDDDSNQAAWKKAVDEDKIGVWKHVLRGLKRTSDGGFDRSASISDRYGISTLPTKILVDPNGIIIGRYGSGSQDDEAMDKKLAELFGS
ncbi:TlpA disulfide reductase family protein [Parapedobacter tibetensis]|uniref:TlpA disulfide reductase family protein n=1 Tax=Parapedobacter tibetensis TaxID=2972951 RepID=UPI00214DC9E6|nr:TlpA disulfide reductase family protein [Parapedobacter tibetensis]